MTPPSAAPYIVVAALLALLACSGGSSDPTSSTSTSPTSRPVAATLSPVEDEELAEAERLYAEGSFEEGVAAFELVARRGSPAAQSEASWRLAQIYYDRGDNREALALVEAYVDGNRSPDRERHALLLLGTLRMATGDLDGGEDAFRDYLETGGPAAPYAQLRLAALNAGRREYAAAADLQREALLAELPASTATEVRFDLAANLDETGDAAAAIDQYDALAADETADAYSRGEALWLLAELAAEEGDAARAADALYDTVWLYPWHDRALEALDDPRAELRPPSTRQRALVYFQHYASEAALTAFNEIAADPNADVPEAYYYLGILAERAGDYEGAKAYYDAVLAALGETRTHLTGETLRNRGATLEALGRIDEAVVSYAGSGMRDALFRAGWLSYTALGDPVSAIEYFGTSGSIVGPVHEFAEGRFWAAHVYEATGNPLHAQEALRLIVRRAPWDFYGLRAAAELNGSGPFPVVSDVPANTPPDYHAIEAWLGAEPAGDPLFEMYMERGFELYDSGFRSEAGSEFDAALAMPTYSQWQLYRLARAAENRGMPWLQTRAAWALTHQPPPFPRGTGSSPPVPAPREAFQLVYPIAYRELVNAAAAEHGVDPYLLLAAMRQESLYAPDAASPAGASGLMQIIPSTGEDIAAQLGTEDYTQLDLLRPKVSIKFGAYYLGTQLEGFGGRPEAALAAYNGGPGNAGRWLDAAGSDRDVFIETIDYSETRAYVELVLENYALYLWAYGLTPAPEIPLD